MLHPKDDAEKRRLLHSRDHAERTRLSHQRDQAEKTRLLHQREQVERTRILSRNASRNANASADAAAEAASSASAAAESASGSFTLFRLVFVLVLVALGLIIWLIATQPSSSSNTSSTSDLISLSGTVITIGSSLITNTIVDSNLTVNEDVKIKGSLFVNSVDIDPQTLFLGTQLATDVDIGKTNGNTTINSDNLFIGGNIFGLHGQVVITNLVINGSISSALLDPLLTKNVDTPLPGQTLNIGPVNAGLVRLASSNVTTQVNGLLAAADIRFAGSGSLDASASNTVSIGTMFATSVVIARSTIPTTIGGDLYVNQDLFVAGVTDAFPGNAYVLAPTVASSLECGSPTIPTHLLGNVGIGSILDTIQTGIPLVVGGSNANEVRLGHVGIPVTIEGSANVVGAFNASSITTPVLGAGALAPNKTLFIGTQTVTTSSVVMGAAGTIPVVVQGDMTVLGTLSFDDNGEQVIEFSDNSGVAVFIIGSNRTTVSIPGTLNVTGSIQALSGITTNSIDTFTDDDHLVLGPVLAQEITIGHSGIDIVIDGETLEVHAGLEIQGGLDTLAPALLALGGEVATGVAIASTDVTTEILGNLIVDGTCTIDSTLLINGVLDARTPGGVLEIGSDSASAVVVGTAGAPVSIPSSLTVANAVSATSLVAMSLDRSTPGTFQFGNTFSTTILLGSLNTTTIVQGALVVGTIVSNVVLLSPALDSSAPNIPVTIGAVNASVVLIGRVGHNTEVIGSLLVDQSFLVNSTIDTQTGGGTSPLLIGTRVGGGSIVLGTTGRVVQVGQNLDVLGTATVDNGVLTSSVDSESTTTLHIGTANANGITLGRANVDTTVAGDLEVGQNILLLSNCSIDSLAESDTIYVAPDTSSAVIVGHTEGEFVFRVLGVSQLEDTVLIEDVLDTITATNLVLGGTTATGVVLARAGATTHVLGSLWVSTAGIDSDTNGTPLLIGPTRASSVVLGGTHTSVTVAGTLSLQGTLTGGTGLFNGVDTPTFSALALGAQNATSIQLAKAGVNTHVLGSLTVEGVVTFVNGTLDTLGNPLLLGTRLASSIQVGGPTTGVTLSGMSFQGTQMDALVPTAALVIGSQTAMTQVGQLNGAIQLLSNNVTIQSHLDTQSATTMVIAGLMASSVSIGSPNNNVSVHMYGILNVDGGILLPGSASIDVKNASQTLSIGLHSPQIVFGAEGGTNTFNGEVLFDTALDAATLGEALMIGTTRASHLELGGPTIPVELAGLAIVDQGILMVANSTIDTGADQFLPGSSNTDGILIGPKNAVLVSLSRVGVTTYVRGFLMVDSGSIDTTATSLQLGKSATSIVLGSVGTTSTVAGSLVVNGTQTTTGGTDAPVGQVLYLGAVTAAGVQVGHDSITVRLNSTDVRVESALDTDGASLLLGPVLAKSIIAGSPTIPLEVRGLLVAQGNLQLTNNATIDVSTTWSSLSLGTQNATRVLVGQAGAVVQVNGLLRTDSIDTLVNGDTLAVGGARAGAIVIAQPSVTTTILGPLEAALIQDSVSGNNLLASTGAGGVQLATGSTDTEVLGTLTVDGVATLNAGLLVNNVQSTSGGLITIANGATSGVSLAKSTTTTTVQGPAVLQSSLSFGTGTGAGVVDMVSTGSISIGTQKASGIALGSSTAVVSVGGDLGVSGNVTVGRGVWASSLDTVAINATLSVGGTNAGLIAIGHTGTTTRVFGTLISDLIVGNIVSNSSVLDSSAGTPVQIAPSTASSVLIARSGIPTEVRGPLLADQGITLTGTLDTQTSTTFQLAPSTANLVQIAQPSVTTAILGALTVAQNLTAAQSVLATTFDTPTSVSSLVIGGIRAASVVVGRSGINTIVPGTLQVQSTVAFLSNGSVDCALATPSCSVTLGGSMASVVYMAQSGVSTVVQGPLYIQSILDAPVTQLLSLGSSTTLTLVAGNLTVNTQLTVQGALSVAMLVSPSSSLQLLTPLVQIGAAIDRATAGTLAVGGATATALLLARTGITTEVAGPLLLDGTLTFSGNGVVDTSSSSNSLTIGGTASAVSLGKSSSTVTVQNILKALTSVIVPAVDASAGGLSVCGTQCTGLTLVRSGITATFAGPVTATTVDAISGSLGLGTLASTGSVLVARTGVTTTVQGPLQLASTLDTSTATTFLIGTTLATRIQLGSAATGVFIPGSFNVSTLGVSSIDTTGPGVLSVGTTQATSIVLGKSSTSITLSGLSILIGSALDTVSSSNALVLGGVNANAVTIGHTSVTTTVLSTLLSIASALDTSSGVTLSIGGTTATELDLGQSSITTKLLSANVLIGGTLDTLSSITFTLAPTNANAVSIGRSGITTTIQSSQLSVGQNIDTIAAVTLTLGGSVASGVNIGRASQLTTVLSTTFRITSIIDTVGAVAFNLATATATSVSIGRAAQPTQLLSTTISIAGSLDTITSTVLNLGTSTASGVSIGRAAQPTQLLSTTVSIASTLDTITAVAFNLATSIATSLVMGRATQATQLLSTTVSIAGSLDTITSTVLNLGTSTASGVSIGRAAQATQLLSSIVSIASTLDTISSTTLNLGVSTASSVVVGRVTQATQLLSTVVSITTALDTIGSTSLTLGNSIASSVVIGRASQPTQLVSNTVSIAGALDTIGNVNLTVGATTANGVILGRVNQNVYVNGNLQVESTVNGQSIPQPAWVALSLFAVGTWTATLQDTTAHVFTTTVTKGSYTKLDKMYFCEIHITWTAKGSAVAGETVQVNLPVTSGTQNDFWVFTLGPTTGINAGNNAPITSYSVAGTGFIEFKTLSTTGAAPTLLLVSNFLAAGDITLSGFFSST